MQRLVFNVGQFAGLFFGLSQVCWSAACDAPVFAVQTGIERNVWQEFSANGKQLVREEGNLPFVALAGQVSCEWGAITLRGATTQGVRDYSGVSNTGTGLTTQSAVASSELILSYSYPVNPQLDPFFSVGISRSNRDIRSAGLVLGYPEDFRMYPVQIGLRWRPLRFDNRLTLLAHGGRALNPQLKVSLPGRDVMTLDLGSTLKAGLSADFKVGALAQGQLFFVTQWDRTQSAQSAAKTVTRNGVPTGVANQPRSLLTQAQVSIVWRKSL